MANEVRLADVSVFIRDLTAMKSVYDAISLDGIIKALKEAPTVDAVPVVHGRWIEGKTLEKCSICGKKGFPDWHYCPNCGAKMDGDGDGK